MANILEILIQAKDQASKELEGVTQSLTKMSGELKIAGAAMTAIGVAGVKMVGDARKMNAELGQIALTAGTSTREMRDLALAVTDVTFSLESVIGTFDVLSRAGITNTEQMKKAAKAFDALADATGGSADKVADLLVPAFKLFSEQIPTSAEGLDRFTWLVKRSTVDLEDFGTLMTRMAPYMDDLNMSMDDAIVMLRGLSEKGIQGTAATLALRTAITQAAREGGDLNEILGISQEELTKYRREMEEATGITQEYADVANQQFGILDKLRQKWSELTLKLGTFLTPLEPILAAMTALGPALIFLGTAHGVAAIKTIAHTASLVFHNIALLATGKALKAATIAQWGLNTAMAANPIGIIIGIIGGLVLAVLAIKRHWGDLARFFSGQAYQATKDLTKAMQELGDSMIVDVSNAIRRVKSEFGPLLALLQGTDWETIERIPETELAAMEKVNPLLAARVRGLQAEIDLREGNIGLINQELQALRKAHLEEMLSYKGITEAQLDALREAKPELAQELEGLTPEGWLRLEEEFEGIKKSDAITAFRTLLKGEGAKILETISPWVTAVENFFAAWDKGLEGLSLEELRKFIIDFNNLVKLELLDEETIATVQQKFAEMLGLSTTKFESEQRKPISELSGLDFLNRIFQNLARLLDFTTMIKAIDERIRTAVPNVVPLQSGGIVTKPTLALMGEKGPEAVIPLDHLGTQGGNIFNITFGLLPGDETTMRKVARTLKSLMEEDTRRNTFGQLNRGYYRSSV